MLQYPVAMEIVALASAGISTDFELSANANFYKVILHIVLDSFDGD